MVITDDQVRLEARIELCQRHGKILDPDCNKPPGNQQTDQRLTRQRKVLNHHHNGTRKAVVCQAVRGAGLERHRIACGQRYFDAKTGANAEFGLHLQGVT